MKDPLTMDTLPPLLAPDFFFVAVVLDFRLELAVSIQLIMSPKPVVVGPVVVAFVDVALALVVDPPTTNDVPAAPVTIESGVTDTVITEPPGVSVRVPITKLPSEFAVMTWPPMVMTLGFDFGFGLGMLTYRD